MNKLVDNSARLRAYAEVPSPMPFAAGLPLYRQVEQGIQALIRSSRSKHKLRFTDAELAERFGVSRITVRRAIDELVNTGVLYRIQGVGTFVRSQKLSEKLTLSSFLDPWKSEHPRTEVRVAVLHRVEADEKRAARLNVPVGTKLIYVQRHRLDRSKVVAVDHRYLRADLARRLTAQEVRTASLVDYLRVREHVRLSRGEMEIEARASNPGESRTFGTKPGSPLLIRRVTFYAGADEPVLDGESLYRADGIVYRLTIQAEDT